jgi:CheY-like chemotaxis protein
MAFKGVIKMAESPIVLVVDDDPHMLSVITKSLQKMGNYTVVTANDGVEGLERYFEVHPDCMVIDIKMPNMDGYQLVRALRGDPASASTALVILTAMAQERDKYKGLAAGADQYLLKPVRPVDLVQAVKTAIELCQEDREKRLQDMAELDPPQE